MQKVIKGWVGPPLSYNMLQALVFFFCRPHAMLDPSGDEAPGGQ